MRGLPFDSQGVNIIRNEGCYEQQNGFGMFANDNLLERKHYNVTTDEVRRRLIALWATGTKNIKEVRPERVESNLQASEECGINYSTAKSIVKLMKIEGRIDKKKKRATRRNKIQIDELERLILNGPSKSGDHQN